MLKEILASVSVNFPLHIPYIPNMTYLTKIFTTSASNKTNTPTYGHLHRTLLTQNEPKKKLVPYKKYLMSLIKMVNSNHLLGRQKLVQVFLTHTIYVQFDIYIHYLYEVHGINEKM